MGKPPTKHLNEKPDAGDGALACKLGDRYRAVRDHAVAVLWCLRGAELGDAEAQNNLGSMLLNGIGCERTQYKLLVGIGTAEPGNAVAQRNLAKRYLHGDTVEQDYSEAYGWFCRALRQAYAEAACEIGTMHWLGHGVERNVLAAAEFHLIAAERGDSVACRNLSEYRQELESLALTGNQMASLFLCRMYNKGFDAEKSQSLTWAGLF